MKIRFTCPAGHKLQARPQQAGSTIVCPVCQVMVVVPPPAVADTATGSSASAGRTVKRPPLAPSTRGAGLAAPDTAPATKPSGVAASAAAASKATERAVSPRPAPPPLPGPLPAASATAPAAPPAPKSRWAGEVPLSREVPLPGPAARLARRPPPLPVMPLGEPAAGSSPEIQPGPSKPRPSSDQSDRAHVITVYWLGLSLLLTALTELVPACRSFGLSGAPTWARLLVVLSAVQMVYVLWMVSLPDFSTVWVVMLVYAAAACAYAYALALSLLSPHGREMPFELNEVQPLASAWCAAMLMLTLLASYLCARTSIRWHQAHLSTGKAISP